MIFGIETIILLARRSRVSDLGGRFRRGGSSLDPKQMWFFLAVMVAFVIAAMIASRISTIRSRPGYASPNRLFRQLCKAHKLRLKQQWLLWRLARWQRLQHPACLFLEPARFAPANLGPSLIAHKDRFQEIRNHLMVPSIDDDSGKKGSKKRGKKKRKSKGF